MSTLDRQRHQQELSRQALRAAGIPQEFHNERTTLEPYEKMPGCSGIEGLRALLLSPRKAWGQAVFSVKDLSASRGAHVSYLIARAMVLRGNSVRVITLPAFADMMDGHVAEARAVFNEDLDVAVLLGFCDTDLSEENPYPKRLVHRMEWFLREQLYEERGLVLHLLDPRTDKWWSRGFCAHLRECLLAEVAV